MDNRAAKVSQSQFVFGKPTVYVRSSPELADELELGEASRDDTQIEELLTE